MNSDLTRFLDQSRPHWLRDGTAAPSNFDGSPADWAEIRAVAVEVWQNRATAEFAAKVAEQGFRPHEVAGGALDKGREVSVNGSVVTKVIGVDYGREAVGRARAVLVASEAVNLTLDPALHTTCEMISFGRATGRGWEARLAAAEAAVNARKLEVTPTRREVIEATTAVLDIEHPFSAIGRHFAAGQKRYLNDVVEALDNWAGVIEAQARRICGEPSPRKAGIWHSAWPAYRVVAAAVPLNLDPIPEPVPPPMPEEFRDMVAEHERSRSTGPSLVA